MLLLSSHDFALVVLGLQNRTKMDRAVGSEKEAEENRLTMDRAVGSEKVCSEKERKQEFFSLKSATQKRLFDLISQTAHGVQASF